MIEIRPQAAKKAAVSLTVVSDTDSSRPGSRGFSMAEAGIPIGSACGPDQRAPVPGAVTPSLSHSAI